MYLTLTLALSLRGEGNSAADGVWMTLMSEMSTLPSRVFGRVRL